MRIATSGLPALGSILGSQGNAYWSRVAHASAQPAVSRKWAPKASTSKLPELFTLHGPRDCGCFYFCISYAAASRSFFSVSWLPALLSAQAERFVGSVRNAASSARKSPARAAASAALPEAATTACARCSVNVIATTRGKATLPSVVITARRVGCGARMDAVTRFSFCNSRIASAASSSVTSGPNERCISFVISRRFVGALHASHAALAVAFNAYTVSLL